MRCIPPVPPRKSIAITKHSEAVTLVVMDHHNTDDEGLTLEEWRARAIAAENLVQKLRGLIQKLEDDKAVFLQELSGNFAQAST